MLTSAAMMMKMMYMCMRQMCMCFCMRIFGLFSVSMEKTVAL